MSSALSGVVARLRAGEPLGSVAISEIERLLDLLQGEGWSGYIPADEALRSVLVSAANAAAEARGLAKSDARFKRKAQRLADELANHIAANGAKAYEIKRLEDLLVWICRTEQPIEEIRAVIERTIPRRMKRAEA